MGLVYLGDDGRASGDWSDPNWQKGSSLRDPLSDHLHRLPDLIFAVKYRLSQLLRAVMEGIPGPRDPIEVDIADNLLFAVAGFSGGNHVRNLSNGL